MAFYKRADLDTAGLPVANDDTVAHYKAVMKAQEKVEKAHEKAALQFIKDEHGVDLEAARRNWTFYTFQHSGRTHRNGKITVEQWAAGEHAPNTLLHTYEVSKATLLKRYAPPAK